MISRRNVLKSGAAGIATMVASGSVPATTAVNGIMPSAGIRRAVFDPRHRESRDFAQAFEQLGVMTSPVRNDVAGLWYGDLRDQLRAARSPFVGLTDRSALFCLEELARDLNMRVRYRIDRVVDSGGRVLHQVSGLPVDVAEIHDPGVDERFGHAMARLAHRFEIESLGNVRAQKYTGPFSNAHERALVAWLIA